MFSAGSRSLSCGKVKFFFSSSSGRLHPEITQGSQFWSFPVFVLNRAAVLPHSLYKTAATHFIWKWDSNSCLVSQNQKISALRDQLCLLMGSCFTFNLFLNIYDSISKFRYLMLQNYLDTKNLLKFTHQKWLDTVKYTLNVDINNLKLGL